MTTPRRFTDCSNRSDEGRLLAAGRAEYPEHAALHRAAERLGLPAVVIGTAAAAATVTATTAASTAAASVTATTAASTAAASATSGGAATGSTASATSALLATGFVKATVIGVVIGAGTIGTAELAFRSPSPTPTAISVATAAQGSRRALQAAQSQQPQRELAHTATQGSSNPTELPAPVEPSALSTASQSVQRPSGQTTVDATRQSRKIPPLSPAANDVIVPTAHFDDSSQGVPTSPDPKTHLASEVESLDRARAAASRGDAAGALRELDEFASHQPYRLLVGEVMLVRIDALLTLGRRNEAATLARQLLQLGAPAPQRARLERLARME